MGASSTARCQCVLPFQLEIRSARSIQSMDSLLGLFVVYFAVQISLNYRRLKRVRPLTWCRCGCVNSIRNCCARMCRRGNYRNAHQLLNDDDGGGGEVHYIPLSQGQQEALIACETARTTSPESPSVRSQPAEEEADDALLQF
ncbi:hypothetical protein SprV_0702250000 [Sparganum proliferum]